MQLKYFKNPITSSGITDELPFDYSTKIKPIKLEEMILKPDYHNFAICFSEMPRMYRGETSEELDDGIKINGNESLLYLSFRPRSLHEGAIDRKITKDEDEYSAVPGFIDNITKEEGFKDLLNRGKRQLVTYGINHPNLRINGWAIILNDGEISEGHLNDPMQNLLNKYCELKGGFIGANKLKGLEYHIK